MCQSNSNSLLKNALLSSTIQSICDSTYDGIIIADKNLIVKKANAAAIKILGMDDKFLYKINLNKILRNDILDKIMITGEKVLDEDCTFYVNNSKIRCVVNIIPVKIDIKILGIVLSIRNTKKLHKIVNNVVGYKASFTFDDIITKSESMKNIIKLAKKAAKTNCNILIEGKSGTGKEVFAQSIHNYSARHMAPFVAVNCAAIPRELVESELFGYEKGAFTGALTGGYPGKFELADGGTIFLDEIGELPLDIQSKLLRVLDNLKIVRVGSTHEKSINVRIIAATNKLLEEEVKNNNFRKDLFYRLNVMNLHLIPLSQRTEDIDLFAQYFVNKLNMKNPSSPKYLDSSYINNLKLHNFDGNIRELRNIVERSYYLCEDTTITSKYESFSPTKSAPNFLPDNFKDILPLNKVEKICIENALNHFHGNAASAAQILKISKATIYRKINKFNINLKSFD
ncbi:transcriptional regulator with PAS, ATPase and Fis domain [Clostridium algifaecis]|uniref:Transcriptional regulator with PAS, ATPase and Fis domain n=1 Tax=Clostridium algifaecis TaxID=1472040 RepID=A0ABS4KU59_9CLOT|nr:sigma 54-interacting transcriptional regulator [Clostridium algifaecis]MBP2032981.1 transcriptional regulator with PAS, ATPase and Fis domain [Clostridium algifaecis]